MANHFNCKEQSMLNFKESVNSSYSSGLCSNLCALTMSSSLLQLDILSCKFYFAVIETGAFSFYSYKIPSL
jgi:hypothetical protein